MCAGAAASIAAGGLVMLILFAFSRLKTTKIRASECGDKVTQWMAAAEEEEDKGDKGRKNGSS